MRKIDDYLIDLLHANDNAWLKRMIKFGKIKIEPSGYIGTKRNADILATILNPPYNGEQKVAVEVENDREFDVDSVLRKIKKDQPCPTIAIIPMENKNDAWRFQENIIVVWLWSVKCKWKCHKCKQIFTTTSSRTPDSCSSCEQSSKFDWEGIDAGDEPFIEASGNPSLTWREMQESLRPRAGIEFFHSSLKPKSRKNLC